MSLGHTQEKKEEAFTTHKATSSKPKGGTNQTNSLCHIMLKIYSNLMSHYVVKIDTQITNVGYTSNPVIGLLASAFKRQTRQIITLATIIIKALLAIPKSKWLIF